MHLITQCAHRCAAAPWGQGGAIIAETAALLNLSVTRTKALVSKASVQLGLIEPRKRRSDAGQSQLSAADFEQIAGVVYRGQRAGKNMMSLAKAVGMLHASGAIDAALSPSHIARQLKARGLSRRQLNTPTSHTPMRTEHINAVWQIDASVCVLYKTPKGEMLLLEEGVHYKNKPANLKQVMDSLLVRFVGVEHASGCIGARFYTGGATATNALDFLMWLMTQRSHDGAPMPFHGVPFTLYTDQGGEFKNAPARNFCSAMGIRQQFHAPKNSRATGSVETAQNIFECGFESRLRYCNNADLTVGFLNEQAEIWMHARNGADKHSRHGMTPYAAWSTIGSEHLRLAPSLDIMKSLPVSLAKTRKVSGARRVSYQGAEYDLRYVKGVSSGDDVLVCVNPFAAPAVRVGVTDRDTGEILWHDIAPTEKGWMGYDAAAPVLGKDDYKALPASPADERRKRIDGIAFGQSGQAATPTEVKEALRTNAAPYAGQFDPFADLKAKAASLPTYMQRAGTAHDLTAPTVEAARVPVAIACQRLRAAQGDVYDPGTYAWLCERYGAEGVPEEAIAAFLAARREPAATFTGLKAVGGE